MDPLTEFVTFFEKNLGKSISHPQAAVAKAILGTNEGLRLFNGEGQGLGKTTLLDGLEAFAHSKEPENPLFSDANIQKAINAAAARVGPRGMALVAHLDSDGQASVSLVKKVGSHVAIEAAGIMDINDGVKFDKKHLKGQVEVIAAW